MMATPTISGRIVVPQRGGPDVLQFVEETHVEPKPDEVRVRVEAAGVSAFDVMMRDKRFPGFTRVPFTPGEDIVGIIDKVGSAVTDMAVGERVGGWTFGDGGGYAESNCRPAADLVHLPDGLDPAVGVGMIVNYLTADIALNQAAHAKSGETILVQGAGGGLGSAFLQLGRLAGLKVLGTDVRAKHNNIRADGAVPIDHTQAGVVTRIREQSNGGVDIVFDLIGGPAQLFRSYRSLRRGGRMMMLGMAGTARHGTKIILPSLLLTAILSIWPDGRRIVSRPGMETYPRAHPDWYKRTLAKFFDLALDGRLQPRIADRIALCDASRAHAALESGRISGKVILVTDAYQAPKAEGHAK